MKDEGKEARAILLPLVLITMLIYNLKNPFFGMRNLGDIRLADAKSSNGLIYLQNGIFVYKAGISFTK